MFALYYNIKDLFEFYNVNADFNGIRNTVRFKSKLARNIVKAKPLKFKRAISGDDADFGFNGNWFSNQEDWQNFLEVGLPFYLNLWNFCEGKLDIEPSGNNQ